MNRSSGDRGKAALDQFIRNAFIWLSADQINFYRRLLEAVWNHSDLLSRRAVCGFDVVTALVAFAKQGDGWIRSVETWRCSDKSQWRQIRSLAEHLFARYPMPAFMTSVWLEGEIGKCLPAHDWYKRIGNGENVRQVGIPMSMTRDMAHRFSLAPDHLSMTGALRWAEALSLGGNRALFETIAESRLGRSLEHAEFWRTVIDFFVRSHTPHEQIVPIIDYIHAVRLEWTEGVSAEGVLELVPPCEPNFEIKGRSFAALLRRVREWHAALGKASDAKTTWRPSGLSNFRWVEYVTHPNRIGVEKEAARVWTISELCSGRELAEEGRRMRHCVVSYMNDCVHLRSSIWSLRVRTQNGLHRAVTFEVNLRTRRVVQMRRKYNAAPFGSERALIERWAKEVGVEVPATLRQ